MNGFVGLQLKAKALRDAIEEIEVLKKTKKAQIKEWMTGFEQREGRPPTNQDKEVRTMLWHLLSECRHLFQFHALS